MPDAWSRPPSRGSRTPGVDRTSPLLPFRAPEGVEKLSPVEASRRYLEHLREAWDAKMPDAPFAAQQVLVTVPASFDAVARELTLEAAKQAGYQNITLLEEPQAAFYAWIERHPDWRERVQLGDLILVVDIGGGTTDFTLIAVTETERRTRAQPRGRRRAHPAGRRQYRSGAGRRGRRSAWPKRARASTAASFRRSGTTAASPRKSCSNPAIERQGTAGHHPRQRQRAGRRHHQSHAACAAISTTCWRRASCPPSPAPTCPPRQRRVGLQEIGLPYAADAAITRHLARFLRQQAAAAEHGAVRRGPSGLACPTHVLFNGGVLNAALVRERLLATLDSWLAEEGLSPVKPLSGEDLMHAVSRGAAYYGLARHGRGVRIRGGVPRTYYVGVESAMPSVPGFPAPAQGAHRGAVRHGRRHRRPHPRSRIRPGGGRARRVPLLHLRRRARTTSPAT